MKQKLSDNSIDPQQLNSVVMIQCVDCREEPRNYCSRICCANALKQALYLKDQNPAMAIYILYRDLMTYGFSETYYTPACRQSWRQRSARRSIGTDFFTKPNPNGGRSIL